MMKSMMKAASIVALMAAAPMAFADDKGKEDKKSETKVIVKSGKVYRYSPGDKGKKYEIIVGEGIDKEHGKWIVKSGDGHRFHHRGEAWAKKQDEQLKKTTEALEKVEKRLKKARNKDEKEALKAARASLKHSVERMEMERNMRREVRSVVVLEGEIDKHMRLALKDLEKSEVEVRLSEKQMRKDMAQARKDIRKALKELEDLDVDVDIEVDGKDIHGLRILRLKESLKHIERTEKQQIEALKQAEKHIRKQRKQLEKELREREKQAEKLKKQEKTEKKVEKRKTDALV